MTKSYSWWHGLGWCLAAAGLLSGCQAPSAWVFRQPDRSDYSLNNGPDVSVRLLRKMMVSQLAIAWETDGVALTDETGGAIPMPAGARKVFLKMRGEQVCLAWQRKPEAWDAARSYAQIGIHASPLKINIFTLSLPESSFSRAYDGRGLQLSVKYGSLAVIDLIPLERYIAQVIPEEMDPEHFTLEALKAQAVVARTWALKNLSRHARFGYNFCDGPHCQVYKGRKRLSLRAERAVQATMGEVLNYHGRLAEAFYHSTCGGNTVFVNEVWPGKPIPYLVRVEDHWKFGNKPYCAQSPFARWTIHTSVRRIERALQQQKKLKPDEWLENVQVDFVNRSGRVKRLRATTATRTFLLDANEFRAAVEGSSGQTQLLSNFYTVSVVGRQFEVVGCGLGHGVGLCQWGARGMAQHGFSYQDILAHYFKGTTLAKHYGPLAPVEPAEPTAAEADTSKSQLSAK